MLNPEDRNKAHKSSKQTIVKHNSFKKVIEQLQSTLKKPVEQRFHQQQQHIAQFIEKSIFFSQISNTISSDFAKNIVRRSKVYTITGKKKLYEKEQKMSMIFMPLHGNIYTKRETISDDCQVETLEQTYKSLIKAVPTMSIQTRGIMQFEKRSSMTHSQPPTVAVPNWNELSNLEQINQEGTLLFGDIQKQRHRQNLYVKGEGWFLGITLRLFKQSLLDQYHRLIMQQALYFRKIKSFDLLEDQQLKDFIQRISLVEYKKDEYIFREGDQSQHMYLLIEGELKTSKKAELFKEDPNSLYRRTVKSQCSRRPEQPTNLSYANFQGVYNYSPKKQKIQLSIISPVTICGQEQVVARIPREADLQVITTSVKAYKFTLKELQSTGNGRKIDVQSFINQLFETTTKKRIHTRRQSLRTSLEFQNKRNMNYFFLDTNLKQDKKVHTYREKINNSIFPVKYVDKESDVKPTFHSFNFNQFLQCSKPTKRRNIELNRQERRISRLTHNSSEIVDQVQNSSRLSHRLKSYKHKINIVSPLFDPNYYKRQQKQTLRIENKRRMNMIAVKGISPHSKTHRSTAEA